MFAKRLVVFLTAFAVALLTPTVSYAEDTVVLSQSYAWEQNIDVYVAGEMNLENLSCKVSNQVAEVADSGLLADKGVTVRTTILLDSSASMPSALRDNVITYIGTLIHNIGKNEQYKIVTFGEQLNVLQDFTSDRYDLSNAVDRIEFNEQQSKIYDAIYNTMPDLLPIDGSPCYYRTIVITDGIDDTATGVTKEELYLKLQADRYPIDVVAVSKAKQAEAEKEVSALTRMSGGKYANLHSESDLSLLSSEMAVSGLFWIRAIIPGTLLDGSTRSVIIADGTTSIQFDVKVPVFDVPIIETSPSIEKTPTISPEVETTPVPEPTKPIAPTSVSTSPAVPSQIPNERPVGDYSIVIYIGAGIGFIVLLSVIVAVAAVRGKKKKGQKILPVAGSETVADKTEILGSRNYDNSKSSTGGSLYIRLRNMNNSNQIWELSLSGGILIGRDTSCQVCIDEKSMSRQQCKLYIENDAPVAENVSKANITQLNGELLYSPHPIKEGDKFKCGRVTIMVDSLFHLDSGDADNLNKMTGFLNV